MLQKIRYRLVFNRSGRLNLRGEGLIQIECSQEKRNEMVDGWLVKKIRKTGMTVEIPLKVLFGGAALEIVEKYGGNIEKLTARIGSNQSVNRILKRIFVNAGLPERFTFHTSRPQDIPVPCFWEIPVWTFPSSRRFWDMPGSRPHSSTGRWTGQP